MSACFTAGTLICSAHLCLSLSRNTVSMGVFGFALKSLSYLRPESDVMLLSPLPWQHEWQTQQAEAVLPDKHTNMFTSQSWLEFLCHVSKQITDILQYVSYKRHFQRSGEHKCINTHMRGFQMKQCFNKMLVSLRIPEHLIPLFPHWMAAESSTGPFSLPSVSSRLSLTLPKPKLPPRPQWVKLFWAKQPKVV